MLTDAMTRALTVLEEAGGVMPWFAFCHEADTDGLVRAKASGFLVAQICAAGWEAKMTRAGYQALAEWREAHADRADG